MIYNAQNFQDTPQRWSKVSEVCFTRLIYELRDSDTQRRDMAVNGWQAGSLAGS
jgi:hypothetical protein